MVLWGMGLLLGIASLVGLLWICWRIWRHEMGIWLIPLAWIVVYGGINVTFFTKYMRYMLPLYPFLILMGAALLVTLVIGASRHAARLGKYTGGFLTIGSWVLTGLVLAGTLFQCLALDNVYSQPNTRIQASLWIFQHLPPGTVLTYEQWDDALPFAVDGYNPIIYPQAAYTDAQGQVENGLDLYDDDTPAKAQIIASMLMQSGAITMPTDRLDKSIPRLPERYPLTIHYYQLLFRGQLGFHLAAVFQVRPNFLGITLNDSDADESYSVFDHPEARIFVRDNPFPFETTAQLEAKLMQGVHLPPPDPEQTRVQYALPVSAPHSSDDLHASLTPSMNLADLGLALPWWMPSSLVACFMRRRRLRRPAFCAIFSFASSPT